MDPDTPCRCEHCVWCGKLAFTVPEDGPRCPDCGEPVIVLEE